MARPECDLDREERDPLYQSSPRSQRRLKEPIVVVVAKFKALGVFDIGVFKIRPLRVCSSEIATAHARVFEIRVLAVGVFEVHPV